MPFGEENLRLTYSHACLDISLGEPWDKRSETQCRIVYDEMQFKQEEKIAIELAREIRHDYVEIKSKSVQQIISGLEKLTDVLANYHHVFIVNDRWNPGLVYRDEFIDEQEISDFMIENNVVRALPVLRKFLSVIMYIQQVEDFPISTWRLWHTDNKRHVGAAIVTAIIRLSKEVTPEELKFIRHLDNHEVYSYRISLVEDILPFLDVRTPGLVNLISIHALQQLASGNMGDHIFLCKGMSLVKEALISKKLESRHVASVFIEEANLLSNNLSWSTEQGPIGLISRSFRSLDRSNAWQAELAGELRSQAEEAYVLN